MNASTFDFGSMTTEQLLQLARQLAYELYQRCEPVRSIVVKAIKTVKSWLF